MIVLGIHGGLLREDDPEPSGFAMHDSAAVLVRDGDIVAAVEEERLNRIKHSNVFPSQAIHRCLKLGKIEPAALDYVAINLSRDAIEYVDRLQAFREPAFLAPAASSRVMIRLVETLGEGVERKLRYCHHHDAHAWSAFLPSGFDEALVLSIDGDGENASGMLFDGRQSSLRRLRLLAVGQSLGHFYERLIRIVGYRRFDEYKVMALASYGDSKRYAKLFSKLYQLLPEGNYSLCDQGILLMELINAGLIEDARHVGEPMTQLHLDFAAALQATLERIVLHVLTHYRRATGHHSLCLAGGVAHNCSLNGRILRSGLFDRMFVQPAAHDAGGALGAALSVFATETPTAPRPAFTHLYLGSSLGSEARIEAVVGSWGDWMLATRAADVPAETAALLAQGEVIGWAQGRAEFGPRALGNRSIVADPRPDSNKELINRMVKKREQYRPFAPAVLEEEVTNYFEVPPSATSHPFMVTVVGVRPEKRALLGATTHVDGTARVQTVSKRTNLTFWRLIDEFRKLTGVPILLNTSFNNHAEPIVDSVDDAISCFLTTELTHLVVGPFIATKRDLPADALMRNLLKLVPRVPAYYRLTCRPRVKNDGGWAPVYALEHVKSDYFGRSREISRVTHDMLCHADGRSSVAELLDRTWVAAVDVTAIVQELRTLWEERMVNVRPADVAASEPHRLTEALALGHWTGTP